MRPGTIGWVDLTVADAESTRDFYRDVVGWETAGAVSALFRPAPE